MKPADKTAAEIAEVTRRIKIAHLERKIREAAKGRPVQPTHFVRFD